MPEISGYQRRGLAVTSLGRPAALRAGALRPNAHAGPLAAS